MRFEIYNIFCCPFCQSFQPDREGDKMGHCKATDREVRQLLEYGLYKTPPECWNYNKAKKRPREK